MLPFDQQPPLGPLRSREDVLPGVLQRGAYLRRRRRLALAGPAAAAVLALVVGLVVLQSPSGPQRLHTVPANGGARTPASGPQTPDAGGPGDTSVQSSHPSGGSGRLPGAGTTAPHKTSGSPTTTRPQGASGSSFGPCAPPTTPNDGSRTCRQANDGPKGNYVGTDTNARGCTVHNVGQYTAAHDDFFCQYDALGPGGYTATGPFNLLRIVRNGHTIDIDGMDPRTPRCQPTGFIQPGDHVYVDGRNKFDSSQMPPSAGYTTMSVGDTFHC